MAWRWFCCHLQHRNGPDGCAAATAADGGPLYPIPISNASLELLLQLSNLPDQFLLENAQGRVSPSDAVLCSGNTKGRQNVQRVHLAPLIC